jgi:hypothetical protein
MGAPDADAGPSGRATGGGQIRHQANAADAVTFGFTATDGVKPSGHCDVVDHLQGTHIVCIDVSAYFQSGTMATWSGDAQVDGFPALYRIRVEDNGEPGVGADTFSISAGAYSAYGTLTQGDIQVRG